VLWGKTLDEWNLIHPRYREKMIAHFIYRSQRESFIAEFFSPKERKDDGGYDRMMSAMRH